MQNASDRKVLHLHYCFKIYYVSTQETLKLLCNILFINHAYRPFTNVKMKRWKWLLHNSKELVKVIFFIRFASKSTREDFVQTWHVKVASQRWEKCSIFADNGCTKSDQQLSFLRTNIRLIVVPEKGFHAVSIPSQYHPTSNAIPMLTNADLI